MDQLGRRYRAKHYEVVIFFNETVDNFGYGYFVVKAVMMWPFSPKKWQHGCKAERKTVSDFVRTERLKGGRKKYIFGCRGVDS